MSAGIGRVHGADAAGAFYGYSPLVVLVTASGKFTADSTNATTGIITEGGYTKARKALQTVASIVWLGGQTNNTFAAIIDAPSANTGDGTGGNGGATTGFKALRDALASNCGGVYSDYAITSGTVLAGDGTFTLA
jgi:hypothetical protein